MLLKCRPFSKCQRSCPIEKPAPNTLVAKLRLGLRALDENAKRTMRRPPKNKRESIMSTDLMGTFNDFVTAFNNGDFATVAPLLDNDVVLTKVDDNKPPIIG